jgi:hypothetical protein
MNKEIRIKEEINEAKNKASKIKTFFPQKTSFYNILDCIWAIWQHV